MSSLPQTEWTTKNYCTVNWGRVTGDREREGDAIRPAGDPNSGFRNALSLEAARKYVSTHVIRLASEGSRLWYLAPQGTAFVGVFDFKQDVVMIAPLVPRTKDGLPQSEPMPKEHWQTPKMVLGLVSDKLSKPIEHKPAAGLPFEGQTSHQQLLERHLYKGQRMGDADSGEKRDDCLGFALLKNAGSNSDPHAITLQSITLNSSKFQKNEGNITSGREQAANMTIVWANVIKQVLQVVLPEPDKPAPRHYATEFNHGH